MTRLRTDARFDRALRKLDPQRQRRVGAALAQFVENPARPGLNFEAVIGRPGFHTIRAGRGWRILLRRDEGDIFTAVNVGPHDIYRRR